MYEWSPPEHGPMSEWKLPGVGVTMSDWREDSKMAVAQKVRISMVCGDAPQG